MTTTGLTIQDHPAYKQMQADIAAANAAAEVAKIDERASASRERSQRIDALKHEIETAYEQYDTIRKQAHAALLQLLRLDNQFRGMMGASSQVFDPAIAMKTHLPPLRWNEKFPGMNPSHTFSTTEAAMMGSTY
jgi:hypothetical protein